MLVAKSNRYMVYRNEEWTNPIYVVSKDVSEVSKDV